MANKKSIFSSYGLFWRRDEVEWAPGKGNSVFSLLGRQNQNRPALRVADFRYQTGIYVMYDDFGPYYVGLASTPGIGHRLREHTRDKHADAWDRFSWFGFRGVLDAKDDDGVQRLGEVNVVRNLESKETIREMEALLMMNLGTNGRGNVQSGRLGSAEAWEQVKLDEIDSTLGRLT